jgi:hypothetical protein
MYLLKDSEESFPCRISNERFRIFGVKEQVLLRSHFLKRVEMGHQRLGKLPAHSSLPEIIRFLVTGGTPMENLVDRITDFGKDALQEALKDPVFIRSLWLLVRIPQAMADKNATAALQAIGLVGGNYASVADVLVDFNNNLERAQRTPNAETGDLGELARQAALSAFGMRKLVILVNPLIRDDQNGEKIGLDRDGHFSC